MVVEPGHRMLCRRAVVQTPARDAVVVSPTTDTRRVRSLPRWLVYALVVVVLAAGGVLSAGTAAVRSPLPQLDGEVTLPGLNDRVTVLREGHGVPQVYADQPEDLFEAQGYLAAQDRFYEMDVRRHAAAGRLSELFGASQVATDTYVRTLGFRRTAEAELALQSPSTRRYLDAYASGVNAYLRGRSLGQISLEYTLLQLRGRDAQPEEWSAVDSLAVLKVFGWQLGSNAGAEAVQAQVVSAVGPDRAADLSPDHPLPGMEPVVESGTVVGTVFDPAAGTSAGAPRSAAVPDVPAGARGAVAGARAGAGDADRPVRLGGGHRVQLVGGQRRAHGERRADAVQRPAPGHGHPVAARPGRAALHDAWRPQCPFDVTGFSITGMPGVVIGRNASIAWGLTTSYADVADLYLEDVVDGTARVGDALRAPDRPHRGAARRGRGRPPHDHRPVLAARPAAVRRRPRRPRRPAGSRAGPPTATRSPWPGPARPRAGRWTRSSASTPPRAGRQFRPAAALLGVPSQNLVYADVQGNIGYQLPGQIPIRRAGDGRTPVPGLGHGVRLGRHDPLRPAAVRREPGERDHRRGEQPGDRRALPVRARLGLLLRLAQPGDPRPARRTRRA